MFKGQSGRYITGQLSSAKLCCVIEHDIQFLFGYVLQHSSPQYLKGDWFATSYIANVEEVNGCYLFTTANSIYEVEEFESIAIPVAAIDNIRMGSPPENSIVLNWF